ncbi:GNAT family N-acetyltransferase [Nocardioides sp. HDW12B]|uniref:GNAT family N-acetyltransferase n=1 Tax=Nocardioides sp. HDW12B TaxID=2714939 RepID=UPI00140CD768|nr:GNAT family N-acetyltransferase [Nocardioides sp. HDW12B]QIK67671.1 GNAT family N-acetyltransferase [Nocardioides sp. HDW12B]
MDDVTLRHATHDDIAGLLAFWSVAGENGSRPPDRPELVGRLLDRDAQAVLVAEAGGRIVGTVVSGWDGWRANIYRLAVATDRRGRGLGRLLLRQAEERLRDLGAERFCAMVLDDNASGAALWHAAGYAPQDDWSRWVKVA